MATTNTALARLLLLLFCTLATSDEFTNSPIEPEFNPASTSAPYDPDSTAPIASPSPSTSPIQALGLNLQEVNILIVTDVHSWVAGHNSHEPNLDVDYGDVLSFYKHLQQIAEANHKDVIFVMNGDFVHGSALSQNPPIALASILEYLPFDLVTLGNHDIEQRETIDYIAQPGNLVDWWGPALVTSNILYGDESFGYRYRRLLLPKTKQTLLCFGFIYHMNDHDESVTIVNVQDVIKSTWFTRLVRQTEFYDAILILAHMDVQDSLVNTILAAIRSLAGDDVVVQFVTGHTHKRDFVILDTYASSLQAGYFLDTLGFVSFTTTKQDPTFFHSLIDTNQQVLTTTLAIDDLSTEEGQDLSDFVHQVADSIGANEVIGCAPRTYYLDKPITELDSLHRLYLHQIMPNGFLDRVESPPGMTTAFVQSLPYFLRYNLYEGEITVNDIHNIISDNDVLYRVAHSLRGDKVQRLAEHLANKGTFLNNSCATAVVTSQDGNAAIGPRDSYELFVTGQEADHVLEILEGERVMHPLRDLVDGGDTTVISIWIDFIRNSWECGRPPGYNQGGSVGESIPVDMGANKTLGEKKAAEDDNKVPFAHGGTESAVGTVLGSIVGVIVVVTLAGALTVCLRRRNPLETFEPYERDDDEDPIRAVDHVLEIT